MFKKKTVMLATVFAAFISLSLSGCFGGKVAIKEEDPNTVPTDSYEINWYFQGEPQTDTETVEKAVNDYLKDKINATVKLNRLTGGQYSDKMNAKIQAGEPYDICFTAAWMLAYKTTAANGAWVPLDNYLDKYLPKVKALIGDDVLNNARTTDGKIYAIPNLKEFAEQRGWGFRKDLADKYKIDMSKYAYTENGDCYKSFEMLMPVLQKMQKDEPDMQYPIDWDTTRTPLTFNNTEAVAGPLVMFEHKYPGQVMDYTTTPEYLNSIKIAKDYFDAGLIKKDVMTAADFDQRLKEGKTFAYAEFLKPGKTAELSQTYKYPLAQVGVTPITATNGVGTGAMMAISTTSKNPVRAMRFLELFNTDKTLNNLIIYGVEGKHYKKLQGDYVQVIKEGGYTLSGSQWMMGNVFLNYLTPIEAPDKVEALKKFNDSAIKSQTYGFTFDTAPVQSEIAALNSINSEYNKQVSLGAMDYTSIIPQMQKRYKEAGQDKVAAEYQKQFDAWKASKGQ